MSPSTNENKQPNETLTGQKSNKKSKKQLCFSNTTILKEVSNITINISQKAKAAEPKRCVSVQHILPHNAALQQNKEDLKSVYSPSYNDYVASPLAIYY